MPSINFYWLRTFADCKETGRNYYVLVYQNYYCIEWFVYFFLMANLMSKTMIYWQGKCLCSLCACFFWVRFWFSCDAFYLEETLCLTLQGIISKSCTFFFHISPYQTINNTFINIFPVNMGIYLWRALKGGDVGPQT